MRSQILTVLLALLVFFTLALAIESQKHFIVSYPKATPDHVLEEAKRAIRAAGGSITHEYNLIKGFAATATDTALEAVRVMGKKYNALIEMDQMVTVNS